MPPEKRASHLFFGRDSGHGSAKTEQMAEYQGFRQLVKRHKNSPEKTGQKCQGLRCQPLNKSGILVSSKENLFSPNYDLEEEL